MMHKLLQNAMLYRSTSKYNKIINIYLLWISYNCTKPNPTYFRSLEKFCGLIKSQWDSKVTFCLFTIFNIYSQWQRQRHSYLDRPRVEFGTLYGENMCASWSHCNMHNILPVCYNRLNAIISSTEYSTQTGKQIKKSKEKANESRSVYLVGYWKFLKVHWTEIGCVLYNYIMPCTRSALFITKTAELNKPKLIMHTIHNLMVNQHMILKSGTAFLSNTNLQYVTR